MLLFCWSIACRIISKSQDNNGHSSIYTSHLTPICPFVPVLVTLCSMKASIVPKQTLFLVVLLPVPRMKTPMFASPEYTLPLRSQFNLTPFPLWSYHWLFQAGLAAYSSIYPTPSIFPPPHSLYSRTNYQRC